MWLTENPAVAAEAAEFDDADELLYERIMELTGDGENQHEYSPPAPVPGAGSIDRGRLWELGPSAVTKASPRPDYFEGGLCAHCLMPLGPRTTLPLVIAALTRGASAASVKLDGAGVGNGPRLTIVSEELLNVFTESERNAFEWLPVEGASRGRTYLEFVPRSPTVMNISPIGIPTKYGRCEACGFMWTAPEHGRGRPDTYISDADVLAAGSTLLAVRHPAYASPAVTDERWRTLVGRPELNGIKASPVAIIAAEAVQKPTNFIAREYASRKC